MNSIQNKIAHRRCVDNLRKFIAKHHNNFFAYLGTRPIGPSSLNSKSDWDIIRLGIELLSFMRTMDNFRKKSKMIGLPKHNYPRFPIFDGTKAAASILYLEEIHRVKIEAHGNLFNGYFAVIKDENDQTIFESPYEEEQNGSSET